MNGRRRIGFALVFALGWAAGATALERALATWAPPAVWGEIAFVNAVVALILTLSLVSINRRRKARHTGILLGSVVAVSLAAVPINVRGPGPVIWIVCDTLRADILSLYGYERETTPFLEAWMPELAVFDQSYSQASHTLITAPALLASLHPSTHGLKKRNDILDPKAMLVSEILQQAGYTTFGAFSNPHLTAESGFNQGWDRFLPTAGWANISSERVNREFYRWRKARTDSSPYFALLWYIDPHTPFQWDARAADWAGVNPRESFLHKPKIKDESASQTLRMKTRRHYEASVRSVDNAMRGLVGFLHEQGDYDDALIVFTADHGESLWEHGRFGHNYGLYDHLTRVPLSIRFSSPLHFPKITPWTGRSTSIVSSVDVLPTTLEFLGLPGSDAIQGHSLLSELVTPTGGTAYLEERLMHYGPYEIFGIREGRFKYIWIERFEEDKSPRALLFDLEADPNEKKNLADERPKLAAEFQARIIKRRHEYESIALDPGTAKLDARTRALLEKLGYIEKQGADESPQAP